MVSATAAEQRSLAGIQHALRVEFDDDAQHVIVKTAGFENFMTQS